MTTESLRVAYGQALVDLGQADERIVVLEADLGKSTMSILFQEAYPSRYFEMGIAEQNTPLLSLRGILPSPPT